MGKRAAFASTTARFCFLCQQHISIHPWFSPVWLEVRSIRLLAKSLDYSFLRGRLKCIYWQTWLVCCFISIRAHKSRCPSSPFPSPSQLSCSVIALPLLTPITPLLLFLASPITLVLIGAWWEAFAFPSVLMALQLGPWLAYPFPCLWAVPGAEQMLPRGEQLAAITAMSRTGLCSVTPGRDTGGPPQGSCSARRVSGCTRNEHFLSQNKNNQLCPSRSIENSSRTDRI